MPQLMPLMWMFSMMLVIMLVMTLINFYYYVSYMYIHNKSEYKHEEKVKFLW